MAAPATDFSVKTAKMMPDWTLGWKCVFGRIVKGQFILNCHQSMHITACECRCNLYQKHFQCCRGTALILWLSSFFFFLGFCTFYLLFNSTLHFLRNCWGFFVLWKSEDYFFNGEVGTFLSICRRILTVTKFAEFLEKLTKNKNIQDIA